MLRGTGIHVDLDGHGVLHGIDIAVEAGQVLGLLGPNGAGKSTLLRALAGIQPARSGDVAVNGVSIAELSAESRSRLIAFLPQTSEVHWPLTVYNVVALGRLPHRRVFSSLDAEDEAAIEWAIARTEIDDLRERSVGTLSGGERMRVLIARLLAVQAEVLLVDEPIAGLDPYFQIEFMDLFRAEAGAGRAVVLVLHDLALAARYCDELVLLDEGRLAAQGPPSEVLTDERIGAVYGVESIRGTHEDELYVLPWTRRTL